MITWPCSNRLGDAGARGDNGENGNDGLQGDKGEKGNPGEVGPKGENGQSEWTRSFFWTFHFVNLSNSLSFEKNWRNCKTTCLHQFAERNFIPISKQPKNKPISFLNWKLQVLRVMKV